MEAEVRTKKIGGSIGIIIPNEIIQKEKIRPNQRIKIEVEKVSDVSFLWGKYKHVTIPTEKIMKEIDEEEYE